MRPGLLGCLYTSWSPPWRSIQPPRLSLAATLFRFVSAWATAMLQYVNIGAFLDFNQSVSAGLSRLKRPIGRAAAAAWLQPLTGTGVATAKCGADFRTVSTSSAANRQSAPAMKNAGR